MSRSHSRSGRSEPGRKCTRQVWVREVARPRDMSVGSDQHGRGRRSTSPRPGTPTRHRARRRPARTRSAQGATSKPPGSPRLSSTGRASCSSVKTRDGPSSVSQVEVGHAAPEQRVVPRRGRSGHRDRDQPGERRQGLVGQQVGHVPRSASLPLVGPLGRGLRHRVLQHAGRDGVALGVIGVEKALG